MAVYIDKIYVWCYNIKKKIAQIYKKIKKKISENILFVNPQSILRGVH